MNAPDGGELYRLHSTPGKNTHGEISDAGGTLIGRARRDELSLELFGPEGETALARIARTSKEDMAFPIETPARERLGVLTKQKLEVYSPSIT